MRSKCYFNYKCLCIYLYKSVYLFDNYKKVQRLRSFCDLINLIIIILYVCFQLDSALVEFNKIVAENIVVEPRLKDVEVKLALLRTSDDLLETVSTNLKSLKEEYRGFIQSFNSNQEESESVLWRVICNILMLFSR